MTQTLKITAEPQMQPNQCRFILENSILENGSYRFESKQQAKGSLLAEAIFNVDDVGAVLVSSNSILVTVSSLVDWRSHGKQIGAAIRNAFEKGGDLIDPKLKNSLPSEEEIRQKVMEILDHEINPALAGHGGYIELLDVKNNDIFVKMGGGCQGCAGSQATLKQGVERAIRKAIPSLGAVYDTTDHASGMNPYYQS